MSKIFEALQNVNQKTEEMEKPKTNIEHTSAATMLPSTIHLDLEN